MELSEGLKTSEIISIVISTIALILSIISFIWNRVDISNKKKADAKKWEEQQTADKKRDGAISKNNDEIKKIRIEQNEILDRRLKNIADALYKNSESDRKLEKTEDNDIEDFFEKEKDDKYKEAFAQIKIQKNIVSEKAKRSSIKNKNNEMKQTSKKDKKRNKISETK